MPTTMPNHVSATSTHHSSTSSCIEQRTWTVPSQLCLHSISNVSVKFVNLDAFLLLGDLSSKIGTAVTEKTYVEGIKYRGFIVIDTRCRANVAPEHTNKPGWCIIS